MVENRCQRFSRESLLVIAEHRDLLLEGHFTFLTPNEYTVQLDKPACGLRHGSHIPTFAMSPDNAFIQGDRISEKCIANARDSLIHCHEVANAVKENFRPLVTALAEYDRLLENHEREHADLTEKHSKLRTAFKRDESEQSEYQGASRRIRERLLEMQLSEAQAREQLFLPWLPEEHSVGMLEQIPDFIREWKAD